MTPCKKYRIGLKYANKVILELVLTKLKILWVFWGGFLFLFFFCGVKGWCFGCLRDLFSYLLTLPLPLFLQV